MLKEFVQLASAEVGKRVVQTVSEVSAGEAKSTLKALARTGVGGASVIPGAGLFVAGVVLGAGLGVLFAPRAGQDTRRALKGTLRRLTGRVRSARSKNVEIVEPVVVSERS